MSKYYVIEERYTIEDYYNVFEIMDDALFETLEGAKEYLRNHLKDQRQRDERWERNEFEDSKLYYTVELYQPIEQGSDVFDWVECQYYIRELVLL